VSVINAVESFKFSEGARCHSDRFDGVVVSGDKRAKR